MGFLDVLEDAAKLVGETTAHVATSPQVQYRMGRIDGAKGEARQMFELGRDDGSDTWDRLKACADAYDRGYDDGRIERMNS